MEFDRCCETRSVENVQKDLYAAAGNCKYWLWLSDYGIDTRASKREHRCLPDYTTRSHPSFA